MRSFMRTGFDNDKYLKIQSEHIKERIGKFGDKLYLEFGGNKKPAAKSCGPRVSPFVTPVRGSMDNWRTMEKRVNSLKNSISRRRA